MSVSRGLTGAPARRAVVVLGTAVAVALGSAAQAGASGAGRVTVSPTPNANGWITSSARVTVEFDVDQFLHSPRRDGDYHEGINDIECSGPGVSGGDFSGPGFLTGVNGVVAVSFDVSGDSPSSSGSGVGCTATYQRSSYSHCGLFGCETTFTNPSGTISNGRMVRIDTSPPERVTGHPAIAPEALDWHNVATVVHFNGEDAVSGIQRCDTAAIGGPSSKAVKGVWGTCTNLAGLHRTGLYTYRFDDTPPTLAPTVSADPVVLGGKVTADPHASDLHSGVASASCDQPDTATLGPHTVRCTATDVATNSAAADATYEVVAAPASDPSPPDPPAPTDDTGDTGPTGDPGPTGLQQPQQRQPQPATPVPALTGSLGAIKGNRIKKSALKNGYPLRVTCTADATVAATLNVTSSVAKKLKVKVVEGQKTVAIAWALGECKATGGGTLKLVLAPPAKSKVLKSRGTIATTVRLVEYTTPDFAPFRISRPLKLT